MTFVVLLQSSPLHMTLYMHMTLHSSLALYNLYLLLQVHRLEIVKPYGPAQLISDQMVTNEKMIHFVLPVSSKVADRFQDFLHYFEDICLQSLGKSRVMQWPLSPIMIFTLYFSCFYSGKQTLNSSPDQNFLVTITCVYPNTFK